MSLGLCVGHSGRLADLERLVDATPLLRGVDTRPPPSWSWGGGQRQHVQGLESLTVQARLARDRGLRALRRHLPGLRLTRMLNEGCLADCAWRAGHQLCTAARVRERDYHQRCKGVMLTEPWQLLANDAVRPDDAFRYCGWVD